MKVWLLLACIASQFCLAGGQIFLKHAMTAVQRGPQRWPGIIRAFAPGIGGLTLWFFLWVGLLQRLELSYVYPFEGLSPVLLVLGAAAFLKERLTLRSCVGITLIAAGIALVAATSKG